MSSVFGGPTCLPQQHQLENLGGHRPTPVWLPESRPEFCGYLRDFFWRQLRQRIVIAGYFLIRLDFHFRHAPGLKNSDLPFAQFATSRQQEHAVNVFNIASNHHARFQLF